MEKSTIKHGSNHLELHKFDSFSEMKQVVNEYRNDPENKFNIERNKELSEKFWTREHEEFTGGTPEQCRNLTSYLAPDKLEKVRNEVKADLQSLQLPDVRKRVRFSKNRHEFVPDRYFAGDRRKAFATRDNKRAPMQTVNIVLNMGYNCDIDPFKQAPYNCLGGIIFADMLAKAGYQVNVWVLETCDMHNGHIQMHMIKAKDSRTYLDADTLAILASDPRMFRYWQFQYLTISEDMDKRQASSTLGHQPKIAKIRNYLKGTGFEFDFLFGQCFSHRDTVQQVAKAIKKVNEQNKNLQPA